MAFIEGQRDMMEEIWDVIGVDDSELHRLDEEPFLSNLRIDDE